MNNAKRVLIVDDSSIIRKLIEKHISKLNVEISGMAADGKAALEIFEEVKPDIVTLDLSMPEMDGLEVLEKMLAIKQDTKIVVISALTDKATGIKALKKGAKSFIAKPFSNEKILDTFNKLLV